MKLDLPALILAVVIAVRPSEGNDPEEISKASGSRFWGNTRGDGGVGYNRGYNYGRRASESGEDNVVSEDSRNGVESDESDESVSNFEDFGSFEIGKKPDWSGESNTAGVHTESREGSEEIEGREEEESHDVEVSFHGIDTWGSGGNWGFGGGFGPWFGWIGDGFNGLISCEYYEKFGYNNGLGFSSTGDNQLSCSYTLHEDVDCSGIGDATTPCIELLENVEEFDCNGHTIKGPGGKTNGYGIYVKDLPMGKTITIKNCNVEGFKFGINVQSDNTNSQGQTIFIPPVNTAGCVAEGFPGDQQCCLRYADEGVTKIIKTKVSDNASGIVVSRSRAKLWDIVAVANNKGLEFFRCANIELKDIYACGNSSRDIDENAAFSNSCFITDAKGTIRANIFSGTKTSDNLRDTCANLNVGNSYTTQDLINFLLHENEDGPTVSCDICQ